MFFSAHEFMKADADEDMALNASEVKVLLENGKKSSDQKLANLKEFSIVDADKNNFITYDELVTIVPKKEFKHKKTKFLDKNISQSDEKVFNKNDVNAAPKGPKFHEEFGHSENRKPGHFPKPGMDFKHDKKMPHHHKDFALHLLKKYDKNKDNKLDQNEYKNLVEKETARIKEHYQALKNAVKADYNKDGFISIFEFENAMQKSMLEKAPNITKTMNNNK